MTGSTVTMMRVRVASLLVLVLCLATTLSTVNGFSVPSRPYGVTNNRQSSLLYSEPASSEATASSESIGTETTVAPTAVGLTAEELAMERMRSEEIQQVRTELIQKYVELGKDKDVAESEVDKFLSDPEQSEKFLEMRRYAKAQQEEIDSGLFVQLGGAFLVGMFFTVLPKYLAEYKAMHPDSGIPFL